MQQEESARGISFYFFVFTSRTLRRISLEQVPDREWDRKSSECCRALLDLIASADQQPGQGTQQFLPNSRRPFFS